MSKKNINWEPNIKDAFKIANNIKDIKREIEIGPQPESNVKTNLTKLGIETSKIIKDFNNS